VPRDSGSTADLFWDNRSGRQSGGWSNKLIWGANKLVLASLKNGPLRKEIEDAGGLKLVYIDPPFDVGADFSIDIAIGDERLEKLPSVIEDVAYRDTWENGVSSCLSMIFERLTTIYDLMASDASLYIHLGWQVLYNVKAILDEIFRERQFMNEVIWKRTNAHNFKKAGYVRTTESILYYVKSDSRCFNEHFLQYGEAQMSRYKRDDKGRLYTGRDLTFRTKPEPAIHMEGHNASPK
jgi:adenine-specific DNA-methyltransferase